MDVSSVCCLAYKSYLVHKSYLGSTTRLAFTVSCLTVSRCCKQPRGPRCTMRGKQSHRFANAACIELVRKPVVFKSADRCGMDSFVTFKIFKLFSFPSFLGTSTDLSPENNGRWGRNPAISHGPDPTGVCQKKTCSSPEQCAFRSNQPAAVYFQIEYQ